MSWWHDFRTKAKRDVGKVAIGIALIAELAVAGKYIVSRYDAMTEEARKEPVIATLYNNYRDVEKTLNDAHRLLDDRNTPNREQAPAFLDTLDIILDKVGKYRRMFSLKSDIDKLLAKGKIGNYEYEQANIYIKKFPLLEKQLQHRRLVILSMIESGN